MPPAAPICAARTDCGTAIARIGDGLIDGDRDLPGRRPTGVKADAGLRPDGTRGDLRLVLRAARDHQRHAVLQRIVDTAESAVGDHHIHEGEELVVGEELGRASVRRKWAQALDGRASRRRHHQDVRVGETVEGGSYELGQVEVCDRPLCDEHHRTRPVELGPP